MGQERCEKSFRLNFTIAVSLKVGRMGVAGAVTIVPLTIQRPPPTFLGDSCSKSKIEPTFFHQQLKYLAIATTAENASEVR